MSRFYKALEQAEQEQALKRQAEPSLGAAPPGPVPRTGDSPRSFPEAIDEHLVSLLAPNSPIAEQYRALRHVLEQLHKTNGLSVVAVSSPGLGEGKTTTAINLAGALAQGAEARVLLVDADLRHPAMPSYLGLSDPDAPGLVDATLHPHVTLQDVVRLLLPYNLSALPAGRAQSAFYEVLKSPRLEELFLEARRRYDYIVLDTPPLVPFPDCRLLAKCVDGFLVVVDAHRTSKKLLAEALDVLDPAKVVGLVFNGDDQSLATYYHGMHRSTNGGRAGFSGRRGEQSGGSRGGRLGRFSRGQTLED